MIFASEIPMKNQTSRIAFRTDNINVIIPNFGPPSTIMMKPKQSFVHITTVQYWTAAEKVIHQAGLYLNFYKIEQLFGIYNLFQQILFHDQQILLKYSHKARKIQIKMSNLRRESAPKRMVSTQIQHSNQYKLIDQNYANGTFFMAMSTIEEIQRTLKRLGKGHKQFGMYDKYDYSQKDYIQLKNQLKTQLHLVEISISSFDNTYKQGKGFTLPGNYNIDRVLSRLEESKKLFKKNDLEMFGMCQDLQKLACRQYNQLKHKKMNFDQEKDKKESTKAGHYIYATNLMHNQKQRFIEGNYQEAEFKNNPKYQHQARNHRIGFSHSKTRRNQRH